MPRSPAVNKEECPRRPKCFMFLSWCKKCEHRDECKAWKKEGK